MQVTQALAGEPLTVEERRGGWARVRTAYGYPGWMREDALVAGPGTFGARPFDDPVEAAPGKHHIAFWLGGGRLLHATGRGGVGAVVEEPLEAVDAGPVRFARLTVR